jgi:hypothetical protein
MTIKEVVPIKEGSRVRWIEFGSAMDGALGTVVSTARRPWQKQDEPVIGITVKWDRWPDKPTHYGNAVSLARISLNDDAA